MNKVDKYERELAALVKAIEEKYMKENSEKENPASNDEVKEEIRKAMYDAIHGKDSSLESDQVGDDHKENSKDKSCVGDSNFCKSRTTGQSEKSNHHKQLKFTGISFIKSRKSDDKIHALAMKMFTAAKKEGIDILHTFVDQSSGIDIDRPAIDRMVADVEENMKIDVILVNKLTDITEDSDDLARFFNIMADHGVVICTMQQPGLFPPKCFMPRD